MKITIDTKNNIVKVKGKLYNELNDYDKSEVNNYLRNFIVDNTNLSDYEEDCMWMSYRYCIGRHTIASNMHAADIWNYCKCRMSNERSLFTAFDINREIESSMAFIKPYFHFPLTSLNKIYTYAVDIFCEFLEDFEIKNIDDLIKYRDVYIKLADNERGYTFETITWEEWLRPQVLKICQDFWKNDDMSEDFAWNLFVRWKNDEEIGSDFVPKKFEELTKDMPKPNNYYFHDLEDLFVWNDLAHAFDIEHHHKSILNDGSEVEWFWSWTNNLEEREPNKFYRTFGYRKIRKPLDKWDKGCYIPNESITKDIY